MELKLILLFTKVFQITGYIALAALVVYSFYFGWWWFLFSFVYYKLVVGLFSNQISQHRYFSHRSFTTGPKRHKFLCWVSVLSGFSPVMYASVHRHHHLHSDKEQDPHSPRVSFYHSVVGWTGNDSKNLKIRPAVDWMRDPTAWFIHRNGYKIFLILFALTFIVSWKIAVFLLLAGVGWNYIHMGVLRSALMHIKLPGSYKNFDLDDDSWNNKYLQFYDIGEGLHNNHHKYPNKYNQATAKHEIDPVGIIVKKLFV